MTDLDHFRVQSTIAAIGSVSSKSFSPSETATGMWMLTHLCSTTTWAPPPCSELVPEVGVRHQTQPLEGKSTINISYSHKSTWVDATVQLTYTCFTGAVMCDLNQLR